VTIISDIQPALLGHEVNGGNQIAISRMRKKGFPEPVSI
jgi:hypothetical protein